MFITQYFDDFINNPDKKTLLITGDWGVGKTFLVDEWLQKRKFVRSSQNDVLYRVVRVSLFGVSSFDELYDRILLNEGLLSFLKKYLIKKIGKSTLSLFQSKLKIDLTDLFDYFSKRKKNKINNLLLILDDIERSDLRLSIDELFGFIDNLRGYFKVILIANETKLGKRTRIF